MKLDSSGIKEILKLIILIVVIDIFVVGVHDIIHHNLTNHHPERCK